MYEQDRDPDFLIEEIIFGISGHFSITYCLEYGEASSYQKRAYVNFKIISFECTFVSACLDLGKQLFNRVFAKFSFA